MNATVCSIAAVIFESGMGAQRTSSKLFLLDDRGIVV